MKRIAVWMLAMALVIAACSPGVQPTTVGTTGNVTEVMPSGTPELASPIIPTDSAVAEGLLIPKETDTPMSAATADCASAEANELGAAIARDYDFTSTEQVMTWFCDGAEFEDILVALETTELTGASAEEMLIMLAAGLTWEEIWKEVGLME